MRRLLVGLLLFGNMALAAVPSVNVTFGWTRETPAEATGYYLHQGSSAGVYTAKTDVGNVLVYTVNALGPGTYYFAVTGYQDGEPPSIGRAESLFTNEIKVVVPKNPNKPLTFTISGVVRQ
jgi:hypothetical protein